jgi:hypothetical protein
MPIWLVSVCAISVAFGAAYLLYVIFHPEKF